MIRLLVMDPAVSATNELLKLGVPGAVIIFLGLAVWQLWKKLNDERKECAATIAALQESRLQNVQQNTQKCTEALVNVTTAMNNHLESNAQTQDTLRMIANEYQQRRSR